LADYLTVIDVPKVSGGRRLNILMDGSTDEAVGHLVSGNWQSNQDTTGSVSTYF
jgi:hypothetical protein